MKKRFLPFSLLLVIMILGQSVMADQGHYVPRAKETSSAEAYMSSLRVNQHTGLIDPAWMIAAQKQVANSNSRDNDLYWISMGPDNLGGRTTSIVYNKDNMNEVYIGSMGGGVFYTWNLGISWHQVGENLMVSCMAQAEDGTIYVGTGDGSSAVDYNGLADIDYDNSFVGSGLYAIKNNVMTNIVSPSNENVAGEWSFINDVAVMGNTVIVATNDGLRYSNDAGNTWNYAQVEGADLTGNAMQVKVASDNTIVASVDGMIYIGSLNDLVCHSSSADVTDETGIVSIAKAAGLLDIAVAPSDPNVIYAAAIGANGNHVKIYSSENQGETWRIVLPTVNNSFGHQVYETKGLYNHGLVVDPQNPDCVYVTGANLWRMDRPTTQTNGYYMAVQLSSASMLHPGINAFAFDPRNNGVAYVATDGGIYKASFNNGYLSFVNCNRGYISTRCFNVAPSGKSTRVLGGILEHGPVLIEGLEGTNNLETGELLLPAITPAHYGAFDEANSAGACAVSVINPTAFILSTKDGGLHRTENAGEDYDFSNFTSNQAITFTGYRMPIMLWESFDDENSIDMVWFHNYDSVALPAGTIQCFSNNGGYPFNYDMPSALAAGDSIAVIDPVVAKLFVPSANGNNFELFMTTEPLKFDVAPVWYDIATFAGYPTCMSMSADGDDLFIGTKVGTIVRVSNLRAAVDANTAHPDSVNFAPVVKVITLPVTDQCVTSIGVYNENANKVVVTLGNYGNDSYVLYSSNALAEEPSFVSKQGTGLPKMPVYSSVYTVFANGGSSEEHVLIGTEHGIYRTKNISAASPTWEKQWNNMGDVPVMELKQQVMYHPDQEVINVIDGVTYKTVYPGVSNKGMIYAATYGRGLFRCETYHVQYSNTNVPETPAVVANSNVSMYPNPVRGEAKVNFELNDGAAVSYQVFDMLGRMVKAESLGFFTEGSHEVNVSMNDLSNGAYILRLTAGTQTSSVKFMVY